MIRNVYALLGALVIASCGEFKQKADVPESAPPVPVVRVTEQQCREFAQELEKSINDNDPSLMEQSLDFEAVFERITYGMQTTAQDKAEFLNSSAFGRKLAMELCSVVQSGGGFNLLRLQWNNGRPRALFRVVFGTGGINYQEYLLGDRAGAKVSIIDIYNYTTSELLSITIRRLVLKEGKSPLAKLLDGSSSVSFIAAIDTLSTYNKEGKHSDALRYYYTLPDALKEEKAVQVHRMMAAGEVNDEEYGKALDDVRRMFGDDPSVDILLIDHYFLKKQFDSSLAAVNRLDRSVGGDPHLNFQRANIYVEMGRIKEAKELLQQLKSLDSTSALPEFTLIAISLREKDHDETVRLINQLESERNYEFDPAVMESDSLYADFVRSNQYAVWRREHKGG